MSRLLLVLIVTLVMTNTYATDVADKRPNADYTPSIHDDVDDQSLKGIATDSIVTRDTDKFERNITRVGGMLQYESSYNFTAVGVSTNVFRQGDWSTRVNSLVGAIRKVDRNTAAGLTARVALAVKDDHATFHGEGAWNIRLSTSTGIELIANRDAVETVQALTRGILSNFIAVSVDHAVTDRLTVIGMPTYRRFSDGNEQTGLRGWIIYTLLPEYGLSVNIKARGYESTQNGGEVYFSPDRYERAEIGLRLRRAFGDWRIFATADAGRERINGDIEKPTTQFGLTAQRSFANDASLGAQLAYYRAGDSSNNIGGSDHYAWRMARVYFTIPF